MSINQSHIAFHVFYISLFLLLNITAEAQISRPNQNSRTNLPTNESETPALPKEPPFVRQFTLNDLTTKTAFTDTTLNGFEIFAPHQHFHSAALNLGNLGSSAYPVRYSERNNIFTQIGFNQYNIYRLELEDYKFYELNRPFNDLYFSPQGGQANFVVKAKFSRNFADGVNVSLDYERIKMEGLYLSQAVKDTRFGFAISKISKKHELYINFLANNMNESHNGGVPVNIDSLDSTSNIFRDQRISVETNLDDATSRHQYFSYSFKNIWKKSKLPFDVLNLTRIEHGYYRYSDENTGSESDSLVYKSFLTNERGVRLVNKFVRFTNAFDLGFELKNFQLRIGADYRYLKYNSSLNAIHIHDLALNGDLSYRFKQHNRIKIYTALGAGENIGNLQLNANLEMQLLKDIKLNAHFSSYIYDAYLKDFNLYVTDELVYSNDFSKIKSLRIGGGLNFTKLKLKLDFSSGIINNAVAYDADALPYQLNGSTEYLQFTLKHNAFWRFIGMDNEFLYQSFSDNIFQLPNIYSRHNLYLQTRLFRKNMLARLGIQYFNINYTGALGFMPVSGTFFPVDEDQGYYPISDIYLNMQVDQFRVFIRYENFTDLLQPEVHYLIKDYPQFDGRLMMGVRWIFYD